MIPRSAARFRIFAVVLGLAAGLSGCQTGEPAGNTDASFYVAQTTGTPESRWAHVASLSQVYLETEPTNPSQARKLLDAYTTAVSATAKSILEDRSAPAELREEAVGAYLTALNRRKQIDPEATEKVIAAANLIEAENPKTKIAVIAAFERARIYREQALSVPESEAAPRIKKWGEEVLHIGQMTPASPLLPTILDELGQKTEYFGYSDLAGKLYAKLVERFPDDENAKMAQGVVNRLALKGHPVMDLEGTGRNGTTVSSRDFLGKVLLVDFWATGCKPCLAEMPALEQMRQELQPQGLALLGVALDPNSEDVDYFMQMAKLDWPILYVNASMGNMATPLTLKFGIKAIPFKLVIDREGNLAGWGYRIEDVRPTIERLLLIPALPGTGPETATSGVTRPSETNPESENPK